MIQFMVAGSQSGHRVYNVMDEARFKGLIRYFRAKDNGSDGLDGWALMYYSGRIERYDTFTEARDAALKM